MTDRRQVDMLLKAAERYLGDAAFLADKSMSEADRAVRGLIYTVEQLRLAWEGQDE